MTSEIVLLPAPWRMGRRVGVCPVNARRERKVDESIHPQGYVLEVESSEIRITSSTEQGAFYAQQTLKQLGRQFGEVLPCLTVEDRPDFPVRGVMVDISRDKVPTMASLFELVDLLAEMKINQFQLYTEHTFAYRGHEEVWQDASPMTACEIQKLDRYCKERFIELVPNQNCFGHMDRWLKHARYEALAECPEGFELPWGVRHEKGFTLNPLDPKSLELVKDLFDQLLPNFSSEMFNVGCDETFDLGLGKTRAECERRGKERVYLDFLLKIHEEVKKREKTMQFWGDIILHKPELIGELPKDVIALNWGYEAEHPFEKQTRAFADAGVKFYVAPGTSSWCSLVGRTDNAIRNLKNAAACGLANGAIGYLNTDWGDFGHLQYLPISYPGFAAGAAYSWCLAANENLDLARALDAHVLKDSADVMGKILLDLGNVYQCAPAVGNGSRVFWSLVGDEQRKKLYEGVTKEDYDRTEAAVKEIVGRLEAARMDRADAQLVKDEIKNNAAMVIAGCRHGRRRLGAESIDDAELAEKLRGIIAEHERLWMARNRAGGFRDSVARLEYPLKSYG